MTICEKHECELENNDGGLKEAYNKMGIDYTPSIAFCPECEKEKEEIIAKEEEHRKKKAEFNIKFAGIPRIYHTAEIEDINDDVIIDFINNGNKFLFIQGDCGCGKTHAMCAIKKHFNINKKKCSLFFSNNVILKMKDSFKSDQITESSIINTFAPDQLDSYEFIDHFAIFDDIGTEKLSEYAISIWFNIIDKRYYNGYKTIFTSNYSIKEISNIMSDRIASRLASGIVHKMKGSDKRIIKKQPINRDLTKIF
jgi:DNA replication protein DnaC